MMLRAACLLSALLLSSAPARGADDLAVAASPQEALDQPLGDLVAQNQDIHQILQGLSLSFGIPIVADPEVGGVVSFEIHHTTLAGALDALCESKGWNYEVAAGRFVAVRKFVVRIYPIDYLPMTQVGSSTANVSLSDSTASAGQTGFQAGVAQAGASIANPSGLPSTSAGGSSSMSLSAQSDADFWGRLEADLHSMMREGETVTINRFAGVVQARASLRTQAILSSYLSTVMERVGRQARISVRVVEVSLNNQQKTGIDWSLASQSMGKLLGSPVTLSAASTTASSVNQVGSVTFDPAAFSGTLGIGGVQAALTALSEQGEVHVESKPEISALNNQTAFVQISEDEPYFSRNNTTTINAGGSTVSGTQPITNTNYSQSTVSFGNLLEITVQIADDLTTKLAVCPAVTELKGTVVSPDGQETAPVTGTKRARTTILVRNHETAVIGGFITETKGNQASGIPGLESIPVLGRAFSTKGTVLSRSELVFLVTVNAENPPARLGGAEGLASAGSQSSAGRSVETVGL